MSVGRKGARIVIGSAQPKLRAACEKLAEEGGYALAGAYARAGDLLGAALSLHPELALLGEKLEDLDGLDASESLRGICPCVIILSPRRLEDMTVSQSAEADNRYYVGAHFSRRAILQTMDFALETAARMEMLEGELRDLRRGQLRRRNVNIAKGILMQELGIPEREAHRLLQSCSMEGGRSLESLAEEVLARGAKALEERS